MCRMFLYNLTMSTIVTLNETWNPFMKLFNINLCVRVCMHEISIELQSMEDYYRIFFTLLMIWTEGSDIAIHSHIYNAWKPISRNLNELISVVDLVNSTWKYYKL